MADTEIQKAAKSRIDAANELNILDLFDTLVAIRNGGAAGASAQKRLRSVETAIKFGNDAVLARQLDEARRRFSESTKPERPRSIPISRLGMTLINGEDNSDILTFQYVPNDISIRTAPKYDGGNAVGSGGTSPLSFKGVGAKEITFTLFLNDIGEPDFRNSFTGRSVPFIGGQFPSFGGANAGREGNDKWRLRVSQPIEGLSEKINFQTGFGPGNVEHILRWLEDKSTASTQFKTSREGKQQARFLSPPVLLFTAGPWFRTFKGTVTDLIQVVITKLDIDDIQMDGDFNRTQARASITLTEQIDEFTRKF